MRAGRLLATTSLALSCAALMPQAAAAQDNFIGQVVPFATNFCPRGFAESNGQLLNISSNTALFSLFGTTYGGNGQTTFALPDMRGRDPINMGQGPGLPNYTIGERSGSESVTLLTTQIPVHSHAALIKAFPQAGNNSLPVRNFHSLAAGGDLDYHSAGTSGPVPTGAMAADSVVVAPTGSNVPFGIRDPYLGIRYCVATSGIFPSRN